MSRAPYGARGLKPIGDGGHRDLAASRPVRGAWIETRSPPRDSRTVRRSRPVRGAWIETVGASPTRARTAGVAPRTGRVD